MKWLDATDTQIFAKDGYVKMCSSPWYNFTKMEDSDWEGIQSGIDWVIDAFFGNDINK